MAAATPIASLTKGTRTALLFVLFHQRVCGPLANSLFHDAPPKPPRHCPKSKPPIIKPTAPSTRSSNS